MESAVRDVLEQQQKQQLRVAAGLIGRRPAERDPLADRLGGPDPLELDFRVRKVEGAPRPGGGPGVPHRAAVSRMYDWLREHHPLSGAWMIDAQLRRYVVVDRALFPELRARLFTDFDERTVLHSGARRPVLVVKRPDTSFLPAGTRVAAETGKGADRAQTSFTIVDTDGHEDSVHHAVSLIVIEK